MAEDDCPRCERMRQRVNRERRARTEAEVIAERVSTLATRDHLTGLPNRARLLDHLGLALQRAPLWGGHVGVLFLDIDDFKAVNDTLGHDSGDHLLTEVARRLEQARSRSDVAARLGGDEFVVCCEDVSSEDQLLAIAGRISEAIATPFLLSGRSVVLRASIGARLAERGDSPDDVLRDADVALAVAKRRGKARATIFDEEIKAESRDQLSLEVDLRAALRSGDIRTWFQPIVSLASGTVVGAEALARWWHPSRGMVSPELFVRCAEEAQLMAALTEQVLTTSCARAVEWDFGAKGLVMNVNISAQDLEDDRLTELVADTLRTSGLGPERLCLEVTERQLVSQSGTVTHNLAQLESMGVELAIDDFGVEYASFSVLRQLPVTALKIDRSFVEGLGADGATSADDRAIVEAIAAMSRARRLRTIAEGVETPEQARILAHIGVDHAQGWHYARPAAPELWSAFEANLNPVDLIRL